MGQFFLTVILSVALNVYKDKMLLLTYGIIIITVWDESKNIIVLLPNSNKVSLSVKAEGWESSIFPIKTP